MPKRLRTLPMSSVGGADPQFAISEADWQRIEKLFGKRVPDNVRKVVHESTQGFLRWELPERTAEPIEDSKAIIKACKRGASNFGSTLLAQAFKSSDAGVYATYLIKQNFTDPRLTTITNCFIPLKAL